MLFENLYALDCRSTIVHAMQLISISAQPGATIQFQFSF